MLFLLGQIIFFLLITAILWFAIGWSLRSLTTKTERRALQAEWTNRFNSMKHDRDRYRDEVERLHVGSSPAEATDSGGVEALPAQAKKLREETQAQARKIGQLSNRLTELQARAVKRERDYEHLSDKLEAAMHALNERDANGGAGGEPDAAEKEKLQDALLRLKKKDDRIAQLQHELAAIPHEATTGVVQLESQLHAAMRKIKERDEHIARLNQANLESASTHRQEEFDALIAELDRARETIDAQAAELEAIKQAGPADRNPDHEKYREVIREQEKTIAELNAKLRKQTQVARSSQRPARYKEKPASGDLFGEPPAFLLDKPNGEKDNLKEIHGIGPVLEQTLNRLGIFHFDQIANLTAPDIAWLAANINSFPDRILRDRWVDQAHRLSGRSPNA